MKIATTMTLLVAALLAPLGARPAAAQQPQRDQIFRVSLSLDQAIGEVTRNAYAWEFTPSRGQGIVIPGYGLVFVLAPRPLPGENEGARIIRLRELPRRRALSPIDARALSDMQQQLQAHEKVREEADLALARAMAALEQMARLRLVDSEGRLQQVAAPPEPPESPSNVRVPPPPAATAPVPPVVAAPAAPAPAAPVAPAAPAPPAGFTEPIAPDMTPPWVNWLEAEGEDEPLPDPRQVLAQIRVAVTNVLAAEAPHLDFLRGDDQVVVAVNFVPDGFFEMRRQPTKTLVIRAKKKDLVERASGRLSAAEFEKRTEVTEY